MDEDGNQHILVLIDSFSRYLLLYPIKEKTAMAIARALLSMIGDYGAPKTLVSDRGPCFISDVLHELLQFIGTEHELTLAYSKEENGMVERANKETLRHLRNIIFDRSVLSKWSTYLPLVKRIFNASIHSVTGVAPAKIIYGEAIDLNRNILGREESNSIPKIYMNSWVDSLVKGQKEIVDLVRMNLEKQKEKHLARSEGREITEFEIGSYVLVEHIQSNLRRGPKSKLLPFLKGPMKVIAKRGDRYTLRNLVTRRDKDYHVKRLHEYNHDPQTLSPLKVACKDSGEEFQVEFIERMKGQPNGKKETLQFLVHWLGYDEPTWEPWKNIRHTYALYHFLINQNDRRYHQMIPKNIKYQDSDDEVESDEGEGEADSLGGPV
jgi:transposase InsO family protein